MRVVNRCLFGMASLALAAALLGTARSAPAVDANQVMAAASSITAAEAKQHVEVLADDTFEGREMGSRGGKAASNYLMKQFERHGLRPAGDNGTYFQSFNGQSRNILGLLEGSDATLNREVIVLGAHYDHVGYGRPNNSFGPFGYIHNGADDNASGIAGLLEVVEAFKRLPEPPKRSILFAMWDGEEAGLLGSKHWLAQPTVPLERVVFQINMDMIGRLTKNKVEVCGCRTGIDLRQIVSRANSEQPFDLDFTWVIKADSDHHPFYDRSIPILMFHTGLHKDYHRPSDDVQLINNEGIERVAKLCFRTLLSLADAPKRMNFRSAVKSENQSQQAQLEAATTAAPPRFGIAWRRNDADKQLYVTQIVAGAPAAKADIRVGDRLVSFNGQPIEDQNRFHLELLAASGPTIFQLARRGEAETREVKLEPAGKPVRVGLTWRFDDAEPHAAIVTNLIGGSAAEQAGVRLRDRIYLVNRQPFSNSEELLALVAAPGPLSLVIERNGKCQSVDVTPLQPLPAP